LELIKKNQKIVKLNIHIEEEEDVCFEYIALKILKEAKTKNPGLETFDEKIALFTIIKNEISEMKPIVDIGWLKVNLTPLIK